MKHLLLASVASIINMMPVAFMSETCEVVNVTVKGSDDVIRVDKAAFDADQADDGAKRYTLHKTDADASTAAGTHIPLAPDLIVPPAPSAPSNVAPPAPVANTIPGAPVAPVNPAPDAKLIKKEGTGAKTRFFITNTTGDKLEGPGIDEKGYATDVEAWQAIEALAKPPVPEGQLSTVAQ